MRSILPFLTVIISVVISVAAYAQNVPLQMNVHIVDEAGCSVTNAEIRIDIEQNYLPDSKVYEMVFTDSKGRGGVTNTTSGYLTGVVNKEGYYPTRFKFDNPDIQSQQIWKVDRELILKSIDNPIPLYAKAVSVEVPVIGDPFGYDLEIGDLTDPYGKGVNKDLVFTVSRRVDGVYDFDALITLTFPNEGDGIATGKLLPRKIGSECRMEKVAPTNYESNLKIEFGCDPDNGYFSNIVPDTGYYYRIRSVESENRKMGSALYGKIQSPIEMVGIGKNTPKITFTYYLNPAQNNRNLEFDPDQNLFTNLTSLEQVSDP